jgi:hypothetical protein
MTLYIFKFQVIRWIHSAEGMLSAGFSIPGSLQDAEQLKKEHEQFQTAIEVTFKASRISLDQNMIRVAYSQLFGNLGFTEPS